MDSFIEEIITEINHSNDEIRSFTNSSIDLLNSMIIIDNLENDYFVEASKESSKPTILNKIKESIEKLFKKVDTLITNIFAKMKASAKRRKVENMGKKLNKVSKLGIDLGKIRLRIPNIMEYDSFVYTVLQEYMTKFTTTGYNAALGLSSAPYAKIEVLIKSVEDMASIIASDKFTSNDIDEVLTSIYTKYPDIAFKYRTKPGANLATIKRLRTAPGVYREFVTPTIITNGIVIGDTLISYTLQGIKTYADAKKFKSNAPDKIKLEEVTVGSLYRRTMNMKLDTEENRLKKILNNSASVVTKDMTLQEFSNGKNANENLIQQAKGMCELINAYMKLEMAELNYYYDILIEIDSKLTVKNAKEMEDKIIIDKK